MSAPADKEAEIEKAFVEWQRENSIVLGAKQAEAVRNLKYRISIVTGGPGTGKTTTLRAIMDVYHKVFKQDPILLMAPTGLAAKRMTDSTHMAADTIHHACGLVPANSASGFSPAKDCTIRPGFIGIDEMSMVGTHLFGFAMDAILPVSMSYGIMLTRAVYYTAITRAKTKLVLVGDQAALKRAIDNKRRGVRKSLLGPRIITKTKKYTASNASQETAMPVQQLMFS